MINILNSIKCHLEEEKHNFDSVFPFMPEL